MAIFSTLLSAGLAVANTAKPHTFVGKLLGKKNKPQAQPITPPTYVPQPQQPYSYAQGGKSSPNSGVDINGDGKPDTMWLLIGGAVLAFLLMKKRR